MKNIEITQHPTKEKDRWLIPGLIYFRSDLQAHSYMEDLTNTRQSGLTEATALETTDLDDLSKDRKSSRKSKKEKKNKKKKKHKHHHQRSSSSSDEDSSKPSKVQRLDEKANSYQRALVDDEIKVQQNDEEDDDELDKYGPAAPYSYLHSSNSGSFASSRPGYGGNLLSGEGTAIAEFVRRNERIPRRGEVGYDGEQIKQFEELGYVMSGSRHKRMEAVRKRKENQIFSAEEKRLFLINETKRREEKETKVLNELRHLIRKKEHEEKSDSIIKH